MCPIGPSDFGFDFHASSVQADAPLTQLFGLNPKGDVSGTASAVKRYLASVDDDSFAFGVLWIKHEQDALAGLKYELAPGHGENLGQPQDSSVKLLSRLEVVHVNGRFEHSTQSGMFLGRRVCRHGFVFVRSTFQERSHGRFSRSIHTVWS